MKQMCVLIKIFSAFFFLFAFQGAFAQNADNASDEEMVYKAVEDYVLALYNVEPERIARSVDTSLYKVGYYGYNGKEYYNVPMTYQQLYDLSAKWNAKGDKIKDDTPQKIEIYEVNTRTASAKLTAQWGIDYMHLYKSPEGWKIMNIMWQSDPR